MFGGLEFGLLGLIGLILVIWAFVSIIQSDASTLGKVIWIVVILLFPFLGWIVWLLFGPKSAARRR
jgi:hypothetical protein